MVAEPKNSSALGSVLCPSKELLVDGEPSTLVIEGGVWLLNGVLGTLFSDGNLLADGTGRNNEGVTVGGMFCC